MLPSATTRLLALLGDPVGHSLSPRLQNAAIRHLGLDAVYTALRCDADSVGPLLRGIALGGGGGNVTVPHKAAAAACIERPTAAVLRTGACNTFWSEYGVICGDNTDVAGFRQAAVLLAGPLHGSRVLLIGAGGAAAAAACALLDDGAAEVVLLNRSPARATALALRLDPQQRTLAVAADPRAVHGRAFDLVVNATTLGMHGDDPLPLDLTLLGGAGAALDLVYRSDGTTPWLAHARSQGLRAADGTEMLLGQGAAAFTRWFGFEAPLAVMRAAIGPSAAPPAAGPS
jgi:shikimate dehydrogenase